MGNYPSQMENVYTDKDNSEVNLKNNTVVKINQLEQINRFLYKGPVFVEMGGEWCRQCQETKPILEKLATEYKVKATIASIDIHQNPELVNYFGISNNIPDDPIGPDWRHKYSMEYEETYHGQSIIVTTLQQPEGDWKSKAELLDSGKRVPLGETSDDRYPSEEEAKRAALSIATGALDRARISKGKP